MVVLVEFAVCLAAEFFALFVVARGIGLLVTAVFSAASVWQPCACGVKIQPLLLCFAHVNPPQMQGLPLPLPQDTRTEGPVFATLMRSTRNGASAAQFTTKPRKGNVPMADTVKATNVVWHHAQVSRAEQEARHGHKSAVLWFTGLSASGKSTLANAVAGALFHKGIHTYVLDGDNIRHGLNKDIGFTPEDRVENIRRIGEVAKLFVDAGVLALTAFISPYREDRDKARQINGEDFIEIYVKCDLDVCEQRDPKGLYKKARAGEIPNFTGISAPYEEPLNAELVIDTSHETLEESAEWVIAYLQERGVVGA